MTATRRPLRVPSPGIDPDLEGHALQHVQDHLISVTVGESAKTGRDVTTEREAWVR